MSCSGCKREELSFQTRPSGCSKVTCESLAADIGTSPVLQAKDWHVIFTLYYTNHDRIVNVQQFPSDFSKNQPLEFMVRLNMEAHSLRDCLAVVKFISFVGEGKYRPTLMVGKVRLNVLSFLEPEYSILAHTASTSFKSPSVIDLLRTQSIDHSDDQSSMKDMKDLTFVLEIPTKGVDALSIVEKLLERSKALWRVKPWELCHSTTSVSMVVQNFKISVDVTGDKAIVSSPNPGLVILMKHAIISIVGGPPLQGIDEAILMEAENILQSLEMMEFAGETPLCSEVLNIYKKKIKLINDSLVGVSTLVD
uniref:Uncharacterized protein n=1 Tax=Lygus hesperus TaxID=30085 RepID=A0A146L3Q6_LYGHE